MIRCPHCGAEQLEPELAKSTFCRRCSEYFAITASTLGGASNAAAAPPPKPGLPKFQPASPGSARPEADHPAAASGFRQKVEELLGKPRQRTARCFECSSAHEVSSTAQSSTCKACGAYIDLQDYKINGSFSRNIKTRGSLYLGSKGDLSSSKIVCSQATILGKMRGNLQCFGPVTIRIHGKLFGSVEAGDVIIEKGSDVIFSRPMKAASLGVYGKMSGQVFSDSHVTIYRSGSLDGAVTATGFTVEKGGIFQGELTIAPRQAAPGSMADDGTAARDVAFPPQAGMPLLGGEQKPALG